jgi:hypothetical protein
MLLYNGSMRRFPWLIVVILGFLAARGGASDNARQTSGEASPAVWRAFFPWEAHTQWVYDTLNKKSKDHFTMKVEMDGPWKEKGLSGMILTQRDKRGKMREFLLRKDDGIFIYKLGLSKGYTPEVFTHFNPSVPRVIAPLKPGNKVHWEGRLKVAWVDKPIVFDGEVVGWEDVDVPAGHFHCLKLHYHEKRGDEGIDEDAWYAEGVGQVKYDGGEYVKELKSFKKPS